MTEWRVESGEWSGKHTLHFFCKIKRAEITPLFTLHTSLSFEVFGFEKFKEIFVRAFFKAVFFESIYVVILGNKQEIMF